MSDDLTAFLLARFAEDEAAARDGAPTEWAVTAPPGDDLSLAAVVNTGLSYNRGAAAHIVRHDPARVLAEVDAKRRILGVVLPALDAGNTTLRPVLYALALPFQDHPDYRSEWRP